MIRLPIRYVGSLGETRLMTLFDSGSSLSLINPDLIKTTAIPVPLNPYRKITTKTKGYFIEVKSCVVLQFFVNDIMLSDEFFVIPHLSEEAILGASTMRKWRIKLDFENESVQVNPNSALLRL